MTKKHNGGSQVVNPNKDAQSKMLSGSAWMTVGSITSRILGAVYVIP